MVYPVEKGYQLPKISGSEDSQKQEGKFFLVKQLAIQWNSVVVLVDKS